MGHLFRKMFPDSKIARKYGCARTKTTNIIQFLGTDSSNIIADVLKTGPFSMATDGSTDYEDIKFYPICVRYFNEEIGKVLSVLLSLRECNQASTGENIYKLLADEMNSKGIPWTNLVCFAADNAAVMLGSKKGVAAFIQESSPSVYIAGCSCHLIHLAVQKGAKKLPVKVDDLLVEIYYYLEKSSKRKQALKVIQEDEGAPQHKILKFMFKEREVSNKAKNMKKHKETEKKTKKTEQEKTVIQSSSKAGLILNKMEDKNTLLFAHFLLGILPTFNETNVFLQKDEPCIHLVHHVLSSQFSKIAMRFVKPHVITDAPDLTKIDFASRKNQKDDEDLYIGSECRDYLTLHEESCDMDVFFESVRNFYSKTCTYMIGAFPFGDPVLVNARFLDVSQRQQSKFSQVRFFIQRFPAFLTSEDKKKIEEEVIQFQCDPLPLSVTEAGRLDSAWFELSKIKDAATGNQKYGALFKVAKTVLVMYHSNADCERIFSHVNKNKTEFRSSLSTRTLGGLMTRKMVMTATGTKCHTITHSMDQLKKAKKCTMDNNNS